MYVYILVSVIIIICLIYVFYNKQKVEVKEHYYNILPYKYRWDISSCYSEKCIRDKARKCFDLCEGWPEDGGKDDCRLECLDDADEIYQHLKFNNYNFNRIFPHFDEVSLLHDNNDYV